MDGPSRTVSAAHAWSNRAQESKGMAKNTAEFKLFYETLLLENLGTHSGLLEKQKQYKEYKCSSKSTTSHMTSGSTRTAQSQGAFWLGVHT